MNTTLPNPPIEEFPKPLEFLGQIVQGFPKDVSDSLWAQGVDLDDWDYAILAPPEAVYLSESDHGLCPHEWTLDRLLVGCCSNHWYLAEIRGRKYAIGIAYHS